MGFCTKEEYSRFMHQCPLFERMLVEDGIMLRKYWFSVSDAEQQRRFKSRLEDPMRRWKLSTMDLESITRWEDYSRSKDEMFVHTDIPEAPWYVVESDDKRSARINMIAHLLSSIPYQDVQRMSNCTLPPRPPSQGYVRMPKGTQTYVPDHAAGLSNGPKRKHADPGPTPAQTAGREPATDGLPAAQLGNDRPSRGQRQALTCESGPLSGEVGRVQDLDARVLLAVERRHDRGGGCAFTTQVEWLGRAVEPQSQVELMGRRHRV